MADTNRVREENPELYPKEGKGWEDYEHQKNLKAGTERLDRRSTHPDKNAVKKHGHGGKFTVDGPYTDADYSEHIPAAMDERDPNFIDPADEQADKDAGIPVVEVAKVAATGAGAAHPAS